jgi:hypothetical protein
MFTVENGKAKMTVGGRSVSMTFRPECGDTVEAMRARLAKRFDVKCWDCSDTGTVAHYRTTWGSAYVTHTTACPCKGK